MSSRVRSSSSQISTSSSKSNPPNSKRTSLSSSPSSTTSTNAPSTGVETTNVVFAHRLPPGLNVILPANRAANNKNSLLDMRILFIEMIQRDFGRILDVLFAIDANWCLLVFENPQHARVMVEKGEHFWKEQNATFATKSQTKSPGVFVVNWSSRLKAKESPHFQIRCIPQSPLRQIIAGDLGSAELIIARPNEEKSWIVEVKNRRTQKLEINNVIATPHGCSYFSIKPLNSTLRLPLLLDSDGVAQFQLTFRAPLHSKNDSYQSLVRFDTSQGLCVSHHVAVFIVADPELPLFDLDKIPDDHKRSPLPHSPLPSPRARLPPPQPAVLPSPSSLRQPRFSTRVRLRPLPDYAVPQEALRSSSAEPRGGHYEPWTRTADQHRARLHELLFAEEGSRDAELRDQWFPDVKLQSLTAAKPRASPPSEQGLTLLQLPRAVAASWDGVAHRASPHFQLADAVLLRLAGDVEGDYEGVIERVDKDTLLLSFAESLHAAHGHDLVGSVRFVPSRALFQHQHRAVDSVTESLFWPDPRVLSDLTAHAHSSEYSIAPSHHANLAQALNGMALLNPKQTAFVTTFLNGRVPPLLPFLLRGPTGSGKTHSLLALCFSLLFVSEEPRILVCASSDRAADQFTLDLLKLLSAVAYERDRPQIVRFHHPHRPLKAVTDPTLSRCSLLDAERSAFSADASALPESVRIIITTPEASAYLFSSGFSFSFCSHILVDDASQLTEPAVLIPLSLAGPNTVIVLTGDEQQMPPVVHQRGLEKSLVERLSGHHVFRQTMDPALPNPTTCFLTDCYKTHPFLLNAVAHISYPEHHLTSAGMKPAGAANGVHSRFSWLLQNRRFSKTPTTALAPPLLFLSVIPHPQASSFASNGISQRDSNALPNFNPHEILVVVTLVSDLVTGPARVAPDRIAIIAQQPLQLRYFRTLLSLRSLSDVLVTTLADLRDDLREVVIVSTVRTSRHNDADEARPHPRNSSIIHAPKLLNTAIQRATSLFLVVGDPLTLIADKHWLRLLRFSKDHGCYDGPDFEEAVANLAVAPEKSAHAPPMSPPALPIATPSRSVPSMSSGNNTSRLSSSLRLSPIFAPITPIASSHSMSSLSGLPSESSRMPSLALGPSALSDPDDAPVFPSSRTENPARLSISQGSLAELNGRSVDWNPSTSPPSLPDWGRDFSVYKPINFLSVGPFSNVGSENGGSAPSNNWAPLYSFTSGSISIPILYSKPGAPVPPLRLTTQRHDRGVCLAVDISTFCLEANLAFVSPPHGSDLVSYRLTLVKEAIRSSKSTLFQIPSLVGYSRAHPDLDKCELLISFSRSLFDVNSLSHQQTPLLFSFIAPLLE